MEIYRLSGVGYTDEEMRVLKHICKVILADINEFERRKEKEKKERKKREKDLGKGKEKRQEKGKEKRKGKGKEKDTGKPEG